MKYYRVLQDTFLWDKGAVLSSEGNGYRAVDEIFTKEFTGTEYISDKIIENNPEWFQKVYPVNLLSKTVYKVREEAKALIEENFK